MFETKCLRSVCLLTALLGMAGCGETGSLRVSVSGEEAAVDGWPVGDVGFVDGWSMQFDAVVVSLDGFALTGADGESAGLALDPILVDLAAGDRVVYELDAVGARRWEDVRYDIVPATARAMDVGPVDATIRARMIENGWSMYVSAVAEKDGVTRSLEWGLDLDVINEGCVDSDETAGLVIAAGAVNEAQLTVHLDHLFFDSLRLDTAEMRFDAMSAVAEADGRVTLEGLNRQRIADLRDAEGDPLVDAEGEPVVYDPASADLPEPTLLYHMRAAATTVGHFNGEGHCEYVTR